MCFAKKCPDPLTNLNIRLKKISCAKHQIYGYSEVDFMRLFEEGVERTSGGRIWQVHVTRKEQSEGTCLVFVGQEGTFLIFSMSMEWVELREYKRLILINLD